MAVDNKKNIFTKEGYEKQKEELERLKTVVRMEIAGKLNEATEYGDLSENAAYQSAMEQRDINEAKIGELEDMLANARIVKAKPGADKGVVNIGSIVTIEDENGVSLEFTIVGTGETDLIAKKFNLDSPLASVVMGKKKGDKVQATLPAGKKSYTIKTVK
jgi:transcription elongation factor GreA